MTLGSELRGAVKGRVLVSGDDGFEQARRPWNLAIEQPALAVVEAADADDVASLVRHAKLAGLTVSAQPSGHGATGDVEDVILLRTGRLNDLRVRPEQRVARVGAGARWAQVLAAASPHGLTGLAGSSGATSVVGYTLGGGLSWFGRKHGFAANSVRSFDVVDADGVQATVTAESDPDLFWALRGGSGDFALVTAIEFDLHPAPHLYGGKMLWPRERAPQVLAAYREITATAPEELTVWFDLVSFPGAPPMVGIDVTFLGDTAEGEDHLRPFEKIGGTLSDSRGALPVAELSGIADEPTDPSAGLSRGELLTELDDDAAATLLSEPIDPLLGVQIRHLGGALARPADGGGAAGHLSEPFSLYLFGIPFTPEAAKAVRTRQSDIAAAFVPHTSGRKPYTYLAPGERAAAAFPADALARLRDLKRTRDPLSVFRSNFPVLS